MKAVICCSMPYFDEVHREHLSEYPLARGPGQMTMALDGETDVIFFVHWHWKVGDYYLENYKCVGFHAAPLPFGRGSAPVQNMILHGFENTEITAFHLTGELDAGDVIEQRSMSLLGAGDEIYLRIAEVVGGMIQDFLACPERLDERQPQSEMGDPVSFGRRTPEMSLMPGCDLRAAFDFIRMLDADGYPKAYIEHENLRVEFRNPVLRRDRIECLVEIKARAGGRP